MAVCPECGRRAPLGGGRTVKNAHTMFEYVKELEARLKPNADQKSRGFVDRGRRLAESLHAYGHKDSMVNPDWAAAGSWTKEAQALYARLLLSEEDQDERVRECKFCGGEIPPRDADKVELAGTIGSALAGLLVTIEVVAAEVGRDNPDVLEAERFARNGAGMSKAMHDSAHGDDIMASQLQPHVQSWLDSVFEMVEEIKNENPAGFEAAAQAMGGFEAVGARARWMVDHATWDTSGRIILPTPPWTNGVVT